MCAKRLGKQTLAIECAAGVLSSANAAGKKEGDGPLARCFDYIGSDARFGENELGKGREHHAPPLPSTWPATRPASRPGALDFILSGDLLNQCAGSAYASARRIRAVPRAFTEPALPWPSPSCLAALLMDAGAGEKVAALTSSHFCSAERQFRFPLEYGSVRTPTSAVDGYGGGRSRYSRSDAPAAVCDPRHARPHTRRWHYRHVQHGRCHGSRGLRHTVRALRPDTGREPGLLRRHTSPATSGKVGLGHTARAAGDADGVRPRCADYFDCGAHDIRRRAARGCAPAARAAAARAPACSAGYCPSPTCASGLWKTSALRRHGRAYEPDHLAPRREHTRHLPRGIA